MAQRVAILSLVILTVGIPIGSSSPSVGDPEGDILIPFGQRPYAGAPCPRTDVVEVSVPPARDRIVLTFASLQQPCTVEDPVGQAFTYGAEFRTEVWDSVSARVWIDYAAHDVAGAIVLKQGTGGLVRWMDSELDMANSTITAKMPWTDSGLWTDFAAFARMDNCAAGHCYAGDAALYADRAPDEGGVDI